MYFKKGIRFISSLMKASLHRLAPASSMHQCILLSCGRDEGALRTPRAPVEQARC